MSVFIIKMRLDDSLYMHRETYYVFAWTATEALLKAYKKFKKDVKDYDPGTPTVQSLERLDGTVVR